MDVLIRGGRLLDPANDRDGHHDLYLHDGRIAALDRPPAGFRADQVIDAAGCLVIPGLVDLSARLREPGHEHKATLASETHAAAAGGVTTLICPPDTRPVVDDTPIARQIRRRADAAGFARVLPLGALTKGLAGEHLAELAALHEAGCVAFSNGMHAIANTQVLRRALEYAASFNLTVMLSPLDPWLSLGLAHDGSTAARLGLAGIPVAAEVAQLARDLALVEDVGVRVHFGRLSSARSVAMIAEAKARGLPVTADTAIHYLHLTDEALSRFDSHAYVQPPLRSAADRDALRRAVADGTLDAICSDHQPHDLDAKLGPIGETEPGVSGLDTLLALGLDLVEQDVLSLSTLVRRLSAAPAAALNLPYGHLAVGAVADVTVVAPQRTWVADAGTLQSRGRNSPFVGRTFRGRVTHTLLSGRLVYALDAERHD